MDTHYKLAIFDIGNTLFAIDMEGIVRYLAALTQHSVAEVSHLLRPDETYALFETGKISETNFCQHLSEQLGYPLSVNEFRMAWNNIFGDIFPEIPAILQNLRCHKTRIVALSNTNITHERAFMQLYPELMLLFDEIYCSHHLHLAKPDIAIYEKVMAYEKAHPQEAIFFDDKAENVRAAQDVGIHSVLAIPNENIQNPLFHSS
ncbi:MAG: HAD family phosphatase [Chitinophagales bacterium]|nr:HAD family phosphatase [Bacteroidota bacterium]MCB9042546.1 HAD family phosphatase [Chitinophagales bacterium]